MNTATANAAVVRCPRCDRELVMTPSQTYLECPCPPLDDLAILREHRRSELRALNDGAQHELSANLVIAERPDVDTDDAAAVAEICDVIDQNPFIFAARFLRLEREVTELRQRVDAQGGGR